jgi:hypothetical protein
VKTRDLVSKLIRSFLKSPDFTYRFLQQGVRVAEKRLRAALMVEAMERIIQKETHLTPSQVARFRKGVEAGRRKHFLRRAKGNARAKKGSKLLRKGMEATQKIALR